MTPLQQLVADLQRELLRLGKIPARMTAGTLQLNIHQDRLASVKPTYHAEIEKDVDVRQSRA